KPSKWAQGLRTSAVPAECVLAMVEPNYGSEGETCLSFSKDRQESKRVPDGLFTSELAHHGVVIQPFVGGTNPEVTDSIGKSALLESHPGSFVQQYPSSSHLISVFYDFMVSTAARE